MKTIEISNPLTKRETEILVMLITEKSNMSIADELNISKNTVETHRKNIMKKLNIKSVLGMYRWAVGNDVWGIV